MDLQQFVSSGLIELYALGIATADQAAEVERMAAEYPEVQRELDKVRTALERYGTLYTVQPPAGLRDRILTIPSGVPNVPDAEPERREPTPAPRAEDPTRRSPKGRSGNKLLPLALIGLSVLSLALAVLSVILFNRSDAEGERVAALRAQLTQRDATLDSLQTACADTEETLNQVQSQLDFIQNPNTNPVELTPLRRRRNPAQAIVYWNAEQNRALVNPINLPAIDGNQTYQLWAETPRGLLPVGTFQNTPATFQSVDFEEGAVNLYVSLEPLGGSTTPTAGQVKLIGGI